MRYAYRTLLLAVSVAAVIRAPVAASYAAGATDTGHEGGSGSFALDAHGWADQLITARGTVDFYGRVQEAMGGPEATAEFIRRFMAPGVAHCAGGAGPQPTGQLEALLKWVEDGEAPERLPAERRDQRGAVTRSRPLCPYPLVARYNGSGSTDDAATFTCRTGF